MQIVVMTGGWWYWRGQADAGLGELRAPAVRHYEVYLTAAAQIARLWSYRYWSLLCGVPNGVRRMPRLSQGVDFVCVPSVPRVRLNDACLFSTVYTGTRGGCCCSRRRRYSSRALLSGGADAEWASVLVDCRGSPRGHARVIRAVF